MHWFFQVGCASSELCSALSQQRQQQQKSHPCNQEERVRPPPPSSFTVVPHLDLTLFHDSIRSAVDEPLSLPIVDLVADFFNNNPPNDTSQSNKITKIETTTIVGQRNICYPHTAAYRDCFVTTKDDRGSKQPHTMAASATKSLLLSALQRRKEGEGDTDSFVSYGCANTRWQEALTLLASMERAWLLMQRMPPFL